MQGRGVGSQGAVDAATLAFGLLRAYSIAPPRTPTAMSLVRHPPPARLQRSTGALDLRFAADEEGVTRLADLYQHDPCRALFPYAEPGDIPQAVIVTTSGGLTGGDCIAVSLGMGAGARALVTTQAAEKIYRSRGDDTHFSTAIDVADGAWLEWLPQETILFDGARFRRETRIALAATARLLAAEIVVFGRTARGEAFAAGRYADRWRIWRGGRLVWADALGTGSPPGPALAHPAGFGGAVAIATLVHAGPEAPSLLAPARAWLEALPMRAGVTLVNGVLIARILGTNSQHLRSAVAQIWGNIRHAAVNLPAAVPRSWYT